MHIAFLALNTYLKFFIFFHVIFVDYCKMSSNLVSYSSGEEEEDKGRKHADANYDDVQMDMSDDNDEAPVSSEAAMFSSKEDFKAYQRQFSDQMIV